MSELYENISIEDMPNDDWVDIAKICGVDLAVKLLKDFAGLTIPVPKTWDEKLKKKYIKKHYNGDRKSMKKVVRVCDISERQVYQIYKEVINQLKLFDGLNEED